MIASSAFSWRGIGVPAEVEVQAAEVAQDVDRRVDRQREREAGDAVGDDRERGAGVRDDEAEVRVARHGAVEHEVHDARVVSKRNSSIGRGRPNDVCSQQTGDVGWMRTRAPRRSSSRNTGSHAGSPR